LLVAALARAVQPEVVVETGTCTGRTALAVAHALADNGHGHLWTVEIDISLARQARVLLDGLPATAVCADSLTWEPEGRVGLAWIDSGQAHVRVQELRNWRDHFIPGAVIGVHDIVLNMGGDVLAGQLDVFLAEAGWPALRLRTPRGVTLAQVP